MIREHGDNRLDRRKVVAELMRDRGQLLVVTGLGSAAYDLMATGDDMRNFYLWGAMGGAAMIGLGLALARPDARVAVITGDGEQLMGLGALATIGAAAPANLTLVVLDNQHYGETGMQSSHTGRGIDLSRVALACGFVRAENVTDMAGVATLRDRLHTGQGPDLACVQIAPDSPARVLPPRDGVEVKNRFRRHLGLETI